MAHSFTAVQSRIQDKRYRCLILESTQQAGARLQHDGGRLVTCELPEVRTIRVLLHACAVQKPILSLGRLAQQGYWSDLRADIGTLSFPDKTQTKRSHTQLHKEESLFFVKGTMVAPLTTAGVSDEVAQELQMPMGPQMLEDVEEPMPARPATLRDPGTPDQIVMEQHNLTHFPSQPGARCASNPEDTIHHTENSRTSMQLYLNFSLIMGTWGMEALHRQRASFVRTDTSSGAVHATMVPDSKKMDMLHVVAATAKWVRDVGYSKHTENQRHELQPVDIRSFDVCEEKCTTIRRFDPPASHG